MVLKETPTGDAMGAHGCPVRRMSALHALHRMYTGGTCRELVRSTSVPGDEPASLFKVEVARMEEDATRRAHEATEGTGHRLEGELQCSQRQRLHGMNPNESFSSDVSSASSTFHRW